MKTFRQLGSEAVRSEKLERQLLLFHKRERKKERGRERKKRERERKERKNWAREGNWKIGSSDEVEKRGWDEFLLPKKLHVLRFEEKKKVAEKPDFAKQLRYYKSPSFIKLSTDFEVRYFCSNR